MSEGGGTNKAQQKTDDSTQKPEPEASEETTATAAP